MKSSSKARASEALHERLRPIRMLRAGVVCTNLPPLSWGYAAAYRLATRLAVGRLCQRFASDLAAVYLRGSTVVDFSVPGLSDIDLTIVLRDEVNPDRHAEIAYFWSRLAGLAPVLEDQPWTLRVKEFRRLGQNNPGVRYRVMEARRSWALLWGADVLGALDVYTPAQRQQALVDDLETRLTQLNGLLFLPRPDDALHRRRTEYLLYKLVLDLARVLASEGHDPLLGRGEVRDHYLDGRLVIEGALGCGSDEQLRSFVEFVARYRLRRCWLAAHDSAAFARLLLDRTVRTLARCYSRPELTSLPGVSEQHEHFYDGERFRPTGNTVLRVARIPDDFESFRREVRDRRLAGTHTLLETDGLRINLANTDPRLGNCTVVPLPGDRLPQ